MYRRKKAAASDKTAALLALYSSPFSADSAASSKTSDHAAARICLTFSGVSALRKAQFVIAGSLGIRSDFTLTATLKSFGTNCLASLKSTRYVAIARSEERRVGKECRSRWSPE